MRELLWIPRDQVISRLREASWTYVRQTDRVISMRKKGHAISGWSISPIKDTLREDNVRNIFRQAEFPPEEIERFFDAATPV